MTAYNGFGQTIRHSLRVSRTVMPGLLAPKACKQKGLRAAVCFLAAGAYFDHFQCSFKLYIQSY